MENWQGLDGHFGWLAAFRKLQASPEDVILYVYRHKHIGNFFYKYSFFCVMCECKHLFLIKIIFVPYTLKNLSPLFQDSNQQKYFEKCSMILNYITCFTIVLLFKAKFITFIAGLNTTWTFHQQLFLYRLYYLNVFLKAYT